MADDRPRDILVQLYVRLVEGADPEQVSAHAGIGLDEHDGVEKVVGYGWLTDNSPVRVLGVKDGKRVDYVVMAPTLEAAAEQAAAQGVDDPLAEPAVAVPPADDLPVVG